ncbi:MAG: hypothetical protein M3N68_09010, partial [Actinomycetota bacterium]|nr:hypothetical protein [Actinomycetota bacterium]
MGYDHDGGSSRLTFVSAPVQPSSEGKGDPECSTMVSPTGVSSCDVGERGLPVARQRHGKAVVMTRQESFKRRIRARMEKTGERYGAARRVLVEQASTGRRRTWAAEPETSDDSVRSATGRGWDEWCDVLDAWPGHTEGHTAIAAHLQHNHGIDGWWAQTVTVGYERITGRRQPYQQPDGTFSAHKSRTVTADPAVLRELLLDETDRADLFPGLDTELRSRPTSKVIRLAIGPGTAQIAIDPRADGKAKVTVEHERLPTLEEVEQWK